MLLDADRFSVLVVDEIHFGQPNKNGHPVAHFILRLNTAADDLLGRDAVNLLTPGSHELDALAHDWRTLELAF